MIYFSHSIPLLDPPVYPHFDIYPSKTLEVLKKVDVALGEIKMSLSPRYPSFNLCKCYRLGALFDN